MNLHLCYDEKVITRAIRYFEEALPDNNKFIILLAKGKETCKHVKVDMPCVYYMHYNTREFWEAVGDVTSYKNIIIHFMGEESCCFLLTLPKGVDITWLIWGGDLYNELLAKRGFLLYANPEDQWKLPLLRKVKKLIRYPLDNLIKHCSFLKRLKAIQRVTHVCARKGDLQLLYEYFPEIKPYIQKKFFYYPVDDIIGDTLKNANSNGNNIIVGNSASFTNNHQYVFNILKEYDLGNRKVIVPLSYGGNKAGALKAGKMLGNSFQPLVDFIPLEEYNQILVSARTFIYGNFRQEAYGNILVAFYLGATVFLDERNPLLKDLKEEGYILYGLKELPDKIDYILSIEECAHNRELVFKHNNKELMLTYIKESFR